MRNSSAVFWAAATARPLSPHGVALTRAIGFHERARAWASIVEGPKLLRAIIANKNVDVTQQTAARILGLIAGGYFITNTPEFDTEALTEELYK